MASGTDRDEARLIRIVLIAGTALGALGTVQGFFFGPVNERQADIEEQHETDVARIEARLTEDEARVRRFRDERRDQDERLGDDLDAFIHEDGETLYRLLELVEQLERRVADLESTHPRQ